MEQTIEISHGVAHALTVGFVCTAGWALCKRGHEKPGR